MPECMMKNETCGFLCTGYEGSPIWKKLHDLPKEMDCESCSEHATYLFQGLHDHVNAGLGKAPYNISNYEKFVKEVNCVYDSCKLKGNC